MIFVVFLHAHVCTPTDTPSLLSCLAPVFIDTDGRMDYKEGQTQTEWLADSMSLHQVHIFLSIKLTPWPLTSIHLQPSNPSLLCLEWLDLSLPHSSIHHCSIWILILEPLPTAIHPFNPPNHHSVPQTIFYLTSWPFTHLFNFRTVTFQTFTFFPAIHAPIHSIELP